MTADLINGLFELLGASLNCLSIRALVRAREVKGVHWGPTVFFLLWGGWNVIYYPSLEQWFSFVGGIAILLSNVVWVSLLIYFRQARTKEA